VFFVCVKPLGSCGEDFSGRDVGLGSCERKAVNVPVLFAVVSIRIENGMFVIDSREQHSEVRIDDFLRRRVEGDRA